MPDSESRTLRIRELAYLRWEEHGRQDGRDHEYWQWAEATVADQEAAQLMQGNGEPAPTSAAKPPRKPRAQPKPPPEPPKAGPAKKPAAKTTAKPAANPPDRSAKTTKKR